MQLSFQTLRQWTAQQAAAVQGTCAQLVDFSTGSVLYAISQANAAVALWFQWLLLLVLQTTRLATSTGTDVDTFLADFGIARLPAVAARGYVALARYSSVATATIPVGASVRTGDLSQSFSVVADPTNEAYSAGLFGGAGGYTLATGVAALVVPVQSTTPGTVGNVQAGAISLLGSAIPGLDTVTNAAALTGGVDPQSDAEARRLFTAFIASRALGTVGAIEYAILSTQQGLSYYIANNFDETGAFSPGKVVITIDDGSGNPAQSVISAVYTSIAAVIAAGVSFAVHGPAVLPVQVALTITVGPGGVKSALQPLVQAAVLAFVNGRPVGALLSPTQISQAAYAVHPAITNVSGITITSGTTSTLGDLAVAPMQVVKATSVIVG